MSLTVDRARVEYRRRRRPSVVALDDVSLEAAPGELLAIVGRSGSGKSTLLRGVAGLVGLDRGRVVIAGRDATRLKPADRQVALVPQDLPLFPHLDVEANIAFGETARRTPRDAQRRKIDAAVELLGLRQLLDRRPTSLSGGERQRVALARALVRRPKLFLLDEPLSGLDGATRLSLRADIKRIQRDTGSAMLYVTHDPQEAMAVADRVAVLASGRIEQIGTPLELFRSPATTGVARLVGPSPMNLLAGPEIGRPEIHTVGIRPERLQLEPAAGHPAAGTRPMLDVSTGPSAPLADGSRSLPGVVTAVELIGEQFLVRTQAAGTELLALVDLPPPVGTSVMLRWAATDEHHFDPTGTRLAHSPPIGASAGSLPSAGASSRPH